jgi:8-amino-7-oxononanoate synthase
VPETDPLSQRLTAGLETLDRAGLRRSLRAPAGIDFSSNDYLGLSRHPLLAQRMAAAALERGCGSTGSRLLRGERECFSRLERRFAQFKGAARALYFSSGYLANIAVLSTFAESGDVIFSDERNHASLIDGARLARARRVVYPHNDVGALRRLMSEERAAGQVFVVTESLFSMDGDFAPLRDLAALCRTCDAALIVDEAHAVGVYGPRGSGLIEEAGVEEDGIEDAVFVSINTAGKALGVAGAFVAGSELAIEILVQRARPFVFSTAAPPPVAAAIEASLDVVESEPERRERLLARSRDLRRLLIAAGAPVPEGASQIIPVMIGENDRATAVADAMQQAGFDVRAIRPPTVPPGTARLRISVHADLPEETLRSFAEALAAETCAAFS